MFQMNLIKNLKTSYEIVLSNDKKLLCHLMGGKTVIFDTNTWEKVIELKKSQTNPSYLHFSQNDKMLYIKNTDGTFWSMTLRIFNSLRPLNLESLFK